MTQDEAYIFSIFLNFRLVTTTYILKYLLYIILFYIILLKY